MAEFFHGIYHRKDVFRGNVIHYSLNGAYHAPPHRVQKFELHAEVPGAPPQCCRRAECGVCRCLRKKRYFYRIVSWVKSGRTSNLTMDKPSTGDQGMSPVSFTIAFQSVAKSWMWYRLLRKEQQSGMGCVCLYKKSELTVPKFNEWELKVLFFCRAS